MSISQTVMIHSEAKHVYHALLHPDTLAEWWGCTAVVEARPGGIWVGGWGQGGDGLGHEAVIRAEISRLDHNKLVALMLGEAEIAFEIEESDQGCRVAISQSGYQASDSAEVLQSWVDAVVNLKTYIEKKHPKPVAPVAKPAAPAPKPAASTPAGDGGAPPGADPYGAAESVASGDARVLDDAGFGITNPHAVVVEWNPNGFGYVEHPKLGKILFDNDGADFDPEPGDKVLLLVLGKRYDGKPKIKRIACPAKGSNIR